MLSSSVPQVRAFIPLALLLLPLASCILFISPDTPGDHCAIQGSTACAACMRDKCQQSIDGCCSDTACSETTDAPASTLAVVDECGEGNFNACASGFRNPRTGSAQAVRSCVTEQCNDACTGGGLPSVQPCEVPRASKNACAKCVYDSCTSVLDKCCADSSCARSNVITDDVSGCVSADAKACAFMQTKSADGLDGALRACIVQRCAPACIGDARPHVNCSLYRAGTSCSCSNSQRAEGPECSVAAVGGRCLFGRTGCSCGAYGCRTGVGSTRSCSCSFDSTGSATTTCSKPTTGRCCLTASSDAVDCICTESTSPCDSKEFEFKVDSCDINVVTKELTDAKLFIDVCSN
jgi:hypothetical protein